MTAADSAPPPPRTALFGSPLTARELLRRTGRMSQVAGITSATVDDGPDRGSRRVSVRAGDIDFDLHPDRCLDLGSVRVAGVPLAWISPAGPASPWRAENGGEGWLRGFAGGLMVTCGLDTFGAPSVADGAEYGLHGRASALQAEQLSTSEQWRDGRFELSVSATMRQGRLFGENLSLRRTIATTLGTDVISVTDVVANDGFEPARHAILYHFNLGWPLLDVGTRLEVEPGSAVHPRDAVAAAGLDRWDRIEAPSGGFAERVFEHRLAPGPTRVRVANADLGLGLEIGFDTQDLPTLYQWSMFGEGAYALGIEPANCAAILGRASAQDAGVLVVLEPGETRTYRLQVRVLRTP